MAWCGTRLRGEYGNGWLDETRNTSFYVSVLLDALDHLSFYSVQMLGNLLPRGSRALQFWEERLDKFSITVTKGKRFGESYLQFEDTPGLRLEIVEREEGEENKWKFGGVTPNVAIKGFSGATLFSSKPEKTIDVLENIMGLEQVVREGDYIRFKAPSDMGNTIDLKLTTSSQAVEGPGTVHHIAWRAEDNEDQLDWKEYVESKGHTVSPVRDRNYFNAIYFREPVEILFEIATDPPGFTHDESLETMGEKIMLPPQFESERERLEAILIPVEVRDINEGEDH